MNDPFGIQTKFSHSYENPAYGILYVNTSSPNGPDNRTGLVAMHELPSPDGSGAIVAVFFNRDTFESFQGVLIRSTGFNTDPSITWIDCVTTPHLPQDSESLAAMRKVMSSNYKNLRIGTAMVINSASAPLTFEMSVDGAPVECDLRLAKRNNIMEPFGIHGTYPTADSDQNLVLVFDYHTPTKIMRNRN
jgi:hypothetical protein